MRVCDITQRLVACWVLKMIEIMETGGVIISPSRHGSDDAPKLYVSLQPQGVFISYMRKVALFLHVGPRPDTILLVTGAKQD